MNSSESLKGILLKKWEFYKGSDEDFSLQARIYHSICLLTILTMNYVAIFSYLNALYAAGHITVALIPIQLYLYYLSRWKRYTNVSFLIYCLIAYAFFTFNFCLTAGLEGPSLLSFLSVYFLSLAISEKRYYLFWTLINVFFVIGVIFIDQKFPQFVFQDYGTSSERIMDWVSTYFVTVLLMGSCIIYIISNYRKEHEKVEKWGIELDQLNDEKSTLLKIVAHDFQSPLLAVKRYVEILKNHELSELEKTRLFDSVSSSIKNTQQLLSDLLTSEKSLILPNGAYAPFNVNQAIRTFINVYTEIAGSKNIVVEVDIPNQLSISTNREAFIVIMRNLIDNAVKYAAKNGKVRINYGMDLQKPYFEITNTGKIADEHYRHQIRKCLKNEPNILTTFGLRLVARLALSANIVVMLKHTDSTQTTFIVELS